MNCSHEYRKEKIQLLREGKTDRVQCLKGCGHAADLQEINCDYSEPDAAKPKSVNKKASKENEAS